MKIWLFITGILGAAVLFLRNSLQRAKIKELKRDASEAKATVNAFEKADMAIAESIRRESEDSTDTHDFNR